jgi:hypothetical protein
MMQRMKSALVAAALVLTSLPGVAQTVSPKTAQPQSTVIVALTRWKGLFGGGLMDDEYPTLPAGQLDMQVIGRLTPSGEWKKMPRNTDNPKLMAGFKNYIAHTHTYTVVSAENHGEQIHSKPARWGECEDYSMDGVYVGQEFSKTAIAADAGDALVATPPLHRLTGKEVLAAQTALKALPKHKLHHVQRLELFSVVIGDRSFLILARGYQPGHPDYDQYTALFAIGELINGAFHSVIWDNAKNNDEQEYPVGVIQDKAGHIYLIDTVTTPETQYFRVYGLRDGKLVVVFNSVPWGC